MPEWTPVARCEVGSVHIVPEEPNWCPDRVHTIVVVSGVDLFVCERHALALERKP